MFETHKILPLVGSTIRTTREDMVRGTYADSIKQLLSERSALVFPQMHLDAEEQLAFAATLGEIFLVGGKKLQKISLDPEVNPKADYLRGTFFWHIDGTKDERKPIR